jgi:hypothetical protein
MGLYTNAGASGAGTDLLSAGASISPLYVFAEVLTPGIRTSFSGTIPSRRVFQAGYIGMGFAPAPPFVGLILYGGFMLLEAGYLFVAEVGSGLPVMDSIFWDLDPGVLVYLQVQW